MPTSGKNMTVMSVEPVMTAFTLRLDAVLSADQRVLLAERQAERAMDMVEAQRLRAEKAEALAEQAILTKADMTLLPNGFYVYFLWGDDPKRPLYVGQSRSLSQRLASHLSNPERRQHIRAITIHQCESEAIMHTREMAEIRCHLPPWNIVGKPKTGDSST